MAVTTPDALETPEEIDAWKKDRLWGLSGNRAISSNTVDTNATRVFFPTSTEQVAAIVKSLPDQTPIACVAGGCESSNAPIACSHDNEVAPVVLDFSKMKGIQMDGMHVTCEAGVVLQELADVVRDHNGALPVGTGPNVGVLGYVLNGGLSGYFSRRLGLLGQRVVRLTLVDAKGQVHELSANDPTKEALFTSLLGAGSALGIVTSITFSVADGSIFQTGGQLVVACETLENTVGFLKSALRFLRDDVLENPNLSMELVATGNHMVVCTFVFYDTFDGKVRSFADPLRAMAESLELAVVADDLEQWSSWYEVAGSLWPVIAEMKGDPLAFLQHCCATPELPSDQTLDCIAEVWLGQAPMTPMSILEIRSLGGVVRDGRELPTGNCKNLFFADLVVIYDAGNQTEEEKRAIADRTRAVLETSKKTTSELIVDCSGTHSQPDDNVSHVEAANIFGSAEAAATVAEVKQSMDPNNRFRYHPFHKMLQEEE